jgi:hypothetical protein
LNISRLFTQSVSLETYLGSGPYGDKFATAVNVPCFLSDMERIVRSSTDEQILSTTTLYAALSTSPSVTPVAGQFSAGSRVTANGRVMYVISAARKDSAGPSSAFHTAVHLT